MNNFDFENHAKKQREIIENQISIMKKNGLFDDEYYAKLRQQTEDLIIMDKKMMERMADSERF
jgi:hypothetical protein